MALCQLKKELALLDLVNSGGFKTVNFVSHVQLFIILKFIRTWFLLFFLLSFLRGVLQMAPPKKKGKKKSVRYTLEVRDHGQVTTIVSGTGNLDAKREVEVMNVIRKSQEMLRDNVSTFQGAASQGHYSKCTLVEKEAEINSSSQIPDSLCLALQKGHPEIVLLLLNSGADVNSPSGVKLPMGFALENSECTVEIVKTLITAGFPKNGIVELSTGTTTLHVAAKMNHLKIVKYLFTLSVDPNVRDKRGLAPIHYAVQSQLSTMVKLLVKNGATIDCECGEHHTPMFYAIVSGNHDMVKLLVSLGANIHLVNSFAKMMPLHFAANLCQFEVVKVLLELGADVNRAVPLTEEIALHSIARADPQKIQQNKAAMESTVELLIEKGSNLRKRQVHSLTPLQVAMKYRNPSVANVLLVNGAKVNIPIDDDVGTTYTALHVAIKSLDSELIKMCLDFGANYNAKDNEGVYPCHLALLMIIFNNMSQTSDFRQSLRFSQILNEQVDLVKMFWIQGFPYDLTLKMKWLDNQTPPFPSNVTALVQNQKLMFTGVKTQQSRMVQKAITQGAEIRGCGTDMPYPVHYIASKGNVTILEIFMTNGAVVNSVDKSGESPLHKAAKAGSVDCCLILLENGAVYNYSNQKCPKTPLEIAKDNNCSEVVTLLTTVGSYFYALRKGRLMELRHDSKIFRAVMNCRSKDGMTLMARALHLNMKESAQKLMKLRMQFLS